MKSPARSNAPSGGAAALVLGGDGRHRGGAGERTGFLRGVTQQATDRPIGRDEFVILDLHPLLDLYMADTALPISWPADRAQAT